MESSKVSIQFHNKVSEQAKRRQFASHGVPLQFTFIYIFVCCFLCSQLCSWRDSATRHLTTSPAGHCRLGTHEHERRPLIAESYLQSGLLWLQQIFSEYSREVNGGQMDRSTWSVFGAHYADRAECFIEIMFFKVPCFEHLLVNVPNTYRKM